MGIFYSLLTLYCNYVHVDGQKIANKLSKQITKITSTIRSLLARHNSLCKDIGETSLSMSDILDVESEVWSHQSNQDTPGMVWISTSTKHDIIQSYMLIKRCEDEIAMVTDEMDCLKEYYRTQISVVSSTITDLESKPSTAFTQGAISLLVKLKWSLELLLHKATTTFNEYFSTTSASIHIDDSDGWSSDTSEDFES